MKQKLQKGEIIFLSILFVACVAIVFASCTNNQRAKKWGGEMTINLEKGQKLVNATWKDADLWILTRPMKEGEREEYYTFTEKSTYGLLEGKIIIVEFRADNPGKTTLEMDIPPPKKHKL
jgi:hypothetical protein